MRSKWTWWVSLSSGDVVLSLSRWKCTTSKLTWSMNRFLRLMLTMMMRMLLLQWMRKRMMSLMMILVMSFVYVTLRFCRLKFEKICTNLVFYIKCSAEKYFLSRINFASNCLIFTFYILFILHIVLKLSQGLFL